MTGIEGRRHPDDGRPHHGAEPAGMEKRERRLRGGTIGHKRDFYLNGKE
jgi:hypothetical protein